MSSPSVFITGITGFVGSYLAEELSARGWRITGMVLPEEEYDKDLEVYSIIQLVEGDLLDIKRLEYCLNKAQADHIVHLAAESAPSKSYLYPEKFFRINVLGTQNLFETARKFENLERIAIFTSSDVYGYVDADKLPLKEDAPLSPLNPYSASKAACHEVGRQYAINFGLPVVEIRPFNMIGPRQKKGFVLPDFAGQVAEVVNGKRAAEMHVGRLTDYRDFLDVRDAVKAIAGVVEKGLPGETYHVCSGESTTVQTLLDLLLECAGIEISVKQDPERMRPARMPVLYGSNAKIKELTGWESVISLRDSVRDTLEYWIDAV